MYFNSISPNFGKVCCAVKSQFFVRGRFHIGFQALPKPLSSTLYNHKHKVQTVSLRFPPTLRSYDFLIISMRIKHEEKTKTLCIFMSDGTRLYSVCVFDFDGQLMVIHSKICRKSAKRIRFRSVRESIFLNMPKYCFCPRRVQ